MSRFVYCLIFLFCSSCGYQVVSSSTYKGTDATHKYPSFYVENIQGDEQGLLQNHIIAGLLKRNYRYCCNQESATFKITLSPLQQTNENVGFTYAPKTKESPNRHFLISNEGKLEVHTEIIVSYQKGGITRTFIVQEDVYYDFQPDLGTENLHNFALGQFEMHNDASKIAQHALYEKLGNLIAQRISYELA